MARPTPPLEAVGLWFVFAGSAALVVACWTVPLAMLGAWLGGGKHKLRA